jgi:NAD(P)-dependent dehydrogenase (short-subunit alcohol dehydrogenase family)
MAGRLQGKVAVITGGCSGLGLGAVELFVAEGAQVVVADLQDEKGRALEARFAGKTSYIHCDVSQETDIVAALARAKGAFGGLDILFNNAGVSDTAWTPDDIDAATWDKVFSICIRGPALGVRHAIPLMKERGGGAIINTASVAGLAPGLAPVAYSSAKAALVHFTKMAAPALAAHGIRINAICPGFIPTPIFGVSVGLSREQADEMLPQVIERAATMQPIGRAGRPADIAEAALYLASDLSGFVTGTHLVVDGGLTVSPQHAPKR